MNQCQTMTIAANVVTKWPLIALTTCAAVVVMIQPALNMGRVTQALAVGVRGSEIVNLLLKMNVLIVTKDCVETVHLTTPGSMVLVKHSSATYVILNMSAVNAATASLQKSRLIDVVNVKPMLKAI